MDTIEETKPRTLKINFTIPPYAPKIDEAVIIASINISKEVNIVFLKKTFKFIVVH